MKFRAWLEANVSIKEMPQLILDAIQRSGGEWSLLQHRRLKPTYNYQAYGVCEFAGKDVKKRGDKFYFKTFYFIKKKLGMEPPEGYFGGPKWWGPSNSPERAEKELAHGEPYDRVTEFNPDIGHRFLTFRGFIEGWRPGMMPGRELDYKTSAQLKGFPIPVSNPGDFRHDAVRIDEFDGLTTPSEVGNFVQTAIDKFYNPGWGNDEDVEPEPDRPLTRSSA